MITAVVVDDEPLAREGLRVALAGEADIEIVGEAEDGPSAVQQICDKLPQLVFLDVPPHDQPLAEAHELNLHVVVDSLDLLRETGFLRRTDRKSTRLNSSHVVTSRMPSSA